MTRELSGKVALVTGGARNIGRAISLALAGAGAAVVGDGAVHMADVSDPDAVGKMVEAAVGRFGRLDILVNNAALREETPFAELGLAEWKRVLGVILDGAFVCAQACLPHLARAGGGSIVNMGGMTAYKGARGRAHVVAAKAGLSGLTRALALELAPQNITVNCVVPGTIETVRGLPGAPERPAHRQGLPVLGRRGEPAEVAETVRFLCGPGARYITGQSVHVNGGGFMA